MQKNSIQLLSKLAVPLVSKGRLFREKKTILRTDFQRDRDRIIHSTAFRRLKHKTQVFVNTTGDHFRTRITHSLEVAQIARTLSKFFNLNEDLSETLSLSHDLGHTPFGHAGEDTLNECMSNFGGFDHNIQTLRIVSTIENKYYKFKGLNLTIETLEGLIKHNGPVKNLSRYKAILDKSLFNSKINFNKFPSLETQVANISDDIAYNNHDIQDGLRANLFSLDELIEIKFFKEIYKKYNKSNINKNKQIVIYQIIRDSIDIMVKDIIKNTLINIKKKKIKSFNDVISSDLSLVNFSDNLRTIINEIRAFLRVKMYNNEQVLKRNNEGKEIIIKLFDVISKNPDKFISKTNLNLNKFRAISDFISGMTDRYAINLYDSLK